MLHARELTLRHTVIADCPPSDDDWCVLFNGEEVGRIVISVGAYGADLWTWSVNLGLPILPHNGTAPDFEIAKMCWREAWDRLLEQYGMKAVDRQIARNRETAKRHRRWPAKHHAGHHAKKLLHVGGHPHMRQPK